MPAGFLLPLALQIATDYTVSSEVSDEPQHGEFPIMNATNCIACGRALITTDNATACSNFGTPLGGERAASEQRGCVMSGVEVPAQ